MLDSIYHKILKLFWNHIFIVKHFRILPFVESVISQRFPKICKPLVVLMHGVISIPDATPYDKKNIFSKN